MARVHGGGLRAVLPRMMPLQLGSLLVPLAGTGVVTLVPRLAEVHSVSLGRVALAITIYTLPFATAQLFAGGVAQRFSTRATVVAGYGTFIGGSLGCALAPDFTVFLWCRLLQGIGSALLFPILMALVGEVVPLDRLGRAYGTFQATQMLGMTAGPLVAGVLEVWFGWRWFFVFVAAVSLVSVIWFLAAFGGTTRTRTPGDGIVAVTLQAMRVRRVLLLSLAGASLFFAAVGTNTYLAALLKHTHGLAEDRIGLILALQGAVGIPVAPVAGRLGDGLGRTRLGVAGLSLYAIGALALAAVAATSDALAAVVVLVLGGAAATTWASLGALVIEAVPGLRQPVASVYNAFRFFGYALSPPLLAVVYAQAGFPGVCAVNAIVVLAGAGCVVAARRA
jgi:MFS family permease